MTVDTAAVVELSVSSMMLCKEEVVEQRMSVTCCLSKVQQSSPEPLQASTQGRENEARVREIQISRWRGEAGRSAAVKMYASSLLSVG